MPRKTKEADEKKEDIKKKKSATVSKKETAKKIATTKNATTTKKKTTKTVSTKKTTIKKSTTKKASKVANTSTFSPEYYDLPFKYNKTLVKILAQTPTTLFIYWEISDEDRDNLKKQYGKYFFEITKPVLIIHNETMNYSFEVDINDFANSWYLHVNDSNCEYKIELGRRPIPINYNYIAEYNVEKQGYIEPVNIPYIYVSSSNTLETPNDHVLFNNSNKITFRNIKNNQIDEKDLKDFPFINANNKFINLRELYKFLYEEEFLNTNYLLLGNSSSMSFSSKFK